MAAAWGRGVVGAWVPELIEQAFADGAVAALRRNAVFDVVSEAPKSSGALLLPEQSAQAHAQPLTAGACRRAGVAYSAVAAAFVHKAALELPHPLEVIGSTFKLPPAERRGLMTIVRFGGVSEVARVLGLSDATVKTHLQRIYAKTETRRQADLVPRLGPTTQ